MVSPERINRAPVDPSEIQSTERLGHVLFVPVRCLPCKVLSVEAAARDEFVQTIPGVNSLDPVTIADFEEETSVADELVCRASEAIVGTCRFTQIVKNCWRNQAT